MKTTILSEKQGKKRKIMTTLRVLTLVALILTILTDGKAQSKWDTSTVKCNSIVFKCLNQEGTLFIENTKYEKSDENRKQYDPSIRTYSYVKLLTHDNFLKAFRETFSKERIAQLAKTGEKIDIPFSIGEKGQILSVRFVLSSNSSLTPAEVEVLEGTLLRYIKFDIIGTRVNEPIFYDVYFRVRFSEVEKGNIRFARAMENAKVPS